MPKGDPQPGETWGENVVETETEVVVRFSHRGRAQIVHFYAGGDYIVECLASFLRDFEIVAEEASDA